MVYQGSTKGLLRVYEGSTKGIYVNRIKKWQRKNLGGFALEVGGDSGADAVADAAYGALNAADGSALLHAEDVSDADEAEVVVGDTVAVVHARLVLP